MKIVLYNIVTFKMATLWRSNLQNFIHQIFGNFGNYPIVGISLIANNSITKRADF